jgi:hypothetical protein
LRRRAPRLDLNPPRTAIAHMEAKRRSRLYRATAVLALCVLLVPALSLANVYGSNAYGAGLYGSGIDPVGTVTASPPTVTVTGNTLTIATTFNVPMGTSTIPTVSFSPDISSSFTASSTSWTSTTTVTATYTVNTGLVQTGIVATVSGAKDTYGTVAASASSNAFAIDTEAPSGNVSESPVVVTVSDSKITISTTFSKTMNTSITPTISFSPDISSKLTSGFGIWSSASTTFSVSYTANSAITQTGITANVTGAQDTDGNAAPSATSNPFAIETVSGNGPPVGSLPNAGGGGAGGSSRGYVGAAGSSSGSAGGTGATDSGSGAPVSTAINPPPVVTNATSSASLAPIGTSAAAQASTTISFTRDLKFGMKGDDIRLLQVLLNLHGFQVAAAGPGSPGNETTYFGLKTQIAVAKFQRANSIAPSAGYFGPKTRKVIQGLYNSQ